MTYEQLAHNFLHRQTYLVLAVTLDDNTPWAVPLKLQRYEKVEFEWISKPSTIHSKVIKKRSKVAICLFHPSNSEFKEIGFYAKATARKVSDKEDGYSVYRAIITEAWYNNEEHIKRKLDLKQLKNME